VELKADNHTAHVCADCLSLLTAHRRIHHMKVEEGYCRDGRASTSKLEAPEQGSQWPRQLVASFRFVSRSFA
jgi:hypothetical protein